MRLNITVNYGRQVGADFEFPMSVFTDQSLLDHIILQTTNWINKKFSMENRLWDMLDVSLELSNFRSIIHLQS